MYAQDDNEVNQTLEELAEYEDMVQRTFSSDEECYEFFNKFAKSKGFSVRKSKVRHSKSTGAIITRQFLCPKAGVRDENT